MHQREIFPEGSRDALESHKEKTQKFTTTIYLQRIRINEHSEDIFSVPWSDFSCKNVPYVDSHLNEFGIHLNGLGYPFQKKTVIPSNGLSYLFTKKCCLFEQLGLSI